MSKVSSGLGGNSGAVLAGAAMAVALGLGAYIGFGRDDTATNSAEAETALPSMAEEAQPTDTAPQFDELRRESDGTTIIAGRAAPLSDVRIIVDGQEVAQATADDTGGFAAITSLPPRDVPQVVTLSSDTQGGAVASKDEIILAPTAPAAQLPEQRQSASVEQGAGAPPPVTAEPEQTDETAPAAPLETAPEPPRIAVLRSDADGVSLLNPAETTMTAVALDTIGYSELGEVQLTGRAQPDTAKVRVYLDNRSVISLPVGADGRWRGDLPDVDEGVYTLRVDAVSASGGVSSRVETPFKRESPETLAQASAGSDGPVTSITVQTGATLWAIARDRYGDGMLFVRVFEANADSIRDPDLIYPGQVFDLPN